MPHPLALQLADADPSVRLEACRAVAQDPSAVLLAEAVLPLLGDPDAAIASAASDALASIGSGDPSLRAGLEAALRGESREARWWAAFTLARLGPPGMKLLPVLLDGLEHADGSRRWSAAKILVELGRLEGEVLPVLIHFTQGDERPAARRMAVFALRELAPDRPETTQALLAASEASDPVVRRAGLSALAVVLEDTQQACARLAEAMNDDSDAASRGLAASALGSLWRRRVSGSEAAQDVLERCAEADGSEAVRRAAQAALAAMRPARDSR